MYLQAKSSASDIWETMLIIYNVREVFAALDGTLAKLGVPLKASMEKLFCDSMK